MNDLNSFETIAQLAIGIAGFTGIVLALGKRSQGELTVIERARLLDLLRITFGAGFLSFAPMLVDSFTANAAVSWRVSHGAFAGWNVFCATTFIATIRPQELPMVNRVIAVPGAVVTVFAALVAFGLLQRFSYGIYLTGLLWLLFVSAIQFSGLLLDGWRSASEK